MRTPNLPRVLYRAMVLAMRLGLLAILLSGCFAPAPPQEVSWEEIDAKTVSAAAGSAALTVESFTNQSALEKAVPIWERFDIDLTNATAVRLTWGSLRGVGHDIRIEKVFVDEVDVTLVSPGANCVGGDTWTQEVAWIRVDRPHIDQINVRATEVEESCAPRPDRQFHVVFIKGEVAQTPPYQGARVACGRPGNPFAALDLAAEQLHVHDSHDFDWANSWLVLYDSVKRLDAMSTCGWSWISSHEGNHTWSLGSVELDLSNADGELLINGSPARNLTIPFEEELDGNRFVGEIDVTYFDPWDVREIVVVSDEQLVGGDARGFWRK